MSYTRTLHPAAASSAFICSINNDIRRLGWFFLVNQLVCCVIVIAVACVFANIYAKYPLYWVLPPKLKTSNITTPLPLGLRNIFKNSRNESFQIHHQPSALGKQNDVNPNTSFENKNFAGVDLIPDEESRENTSDCSSLDVYPSYNESSISSSSYVP